MPAILRIFSSILPMGMGMRVLNGIERGIILEKELFLGILYALFLFILAKLTFDKAIIHVKKTGEYREY